jgi:hypothetical protein
MSEENRYNDDRQEFAQTGRIQSATPHLGYLDSHLRGIIMLMLLKDRMETPGKVLAQYEFLQKVESNQLPKRQSITVHNLHCSPKSLENTTARILRKAD